MAKYASQALDVMVELAQHGSLNLHFPYPALPPAAFFLMAPVHTWI